MANLGAALRTCPESLLDVAQTQVQRPFNSTPITARLKCHWERKMMGNWWGSQGWGMGLGFIVMVLFWALAAAGLMAVIRWLLQLSGSDGARPRHQTPIEIARERYARGDITREQFERLKADLAP